MPLAFPMPLLLWFQSRTFWPKFAFGTNRRRNGVGCFVSFHFLDDEIRITYIVVGF